MRWIFGNCCVKPFLLSPTRLENQLGKKSLAKSQTTGSQCGWIWRYLWTVFSQPILKEGLSREGFLALLQFRFECFQGRRLSGQPALVFHRSSSKKVFLWHLNGISCVSVCVCCPLPFHEGPWEWAGSVYFTDSGQWFMHVCNTPTDLSPLQAEQLQFSQPLPTLVEVPVFQSPVISSAGFSSARVCFSWQVEPTCSNKSVSCTEEPSTPDVCRLRRVEGKGHLPQPAGWSSSGSHCPSLPHKHIPGPWSAWHPPGSPDPSLPSCFSASWPLACKVTIPARDGEFFFHLLNVVMSPRVLFSVEAPLSISFPTWLSSTPLRLASFVRRVPSVPPSKLLRCYAVQAAVATVYKLMVAGVQLDFVLLIKALSAPKLSQHSDHFTGHFSSLYFMSCPWRCYGRQSWKSCTSQDKHSLFSMCRTSNFFARWPGITNPCCLLVISFLSFMCLEAVSRSFSIAFPEFELGLFHLPLPVSSFLPFLKTRVTLAFLQSREFLHNLSEILMASQWHWSSPSAVLTSGSIRLNVLQPDPLPLRIKVDCSRVSHWKNQV